MVLSNFSTQFVYHKSLFMKGKNVELKRILVDTKLAIHAKPTIFKSFKI